jgi:hypothetical protein
LPNPQYKNSFKELKPNYQSLTNSPVNNNKLSLKNSASVHLQIPELNLLHQKFSSSNVTELEGLRKTLIEKEETIKSLICERTLLKQKVLLMIYNIRLNLLNSI